VVRRAQSEGPQRVTVRGKDTAVVIRAVELERLLPQERKSPFVEFTESLYVEGFNLSREPDYGRDIEVIGWLLDTNFISTIINPNGAPTVKAWAATQNEKQVLSMYLRVGRV
jgi:prevent-host-death family protein